MTIAPNNKSMQTPTHAILDQPIPPADRERIGSALVTIFRPLGGVDIEQDRSPTEPKIVEP